MSAFSHAAFSDLWASLPADTQDAICAKARWEHMTLSAVMAEWWPELWDVVEHDWRTLELNWDVVHKLDPEEES